MLLLPLSTNLSSCLLYHENHTSLSCQSEQHRYFRLRRDVKRANDRCPDVERSIPWYIRAAVIPGARTRETVRMRMKREKTDLHDSIRSLC